MLTLQFFFKWLTQEAGKMLFVSLLKGQLMGLQKHQAPPSTATVPPLNF